MKQLLPDLSPRLKSAVLAAADNLTSIAHDEGIELGKPNGAATPNLHTILYLLRNRCVEAELEPQPYLGDQLITPQEIAVVLEAIGQIMMSDDTFEFAGRNPRWFFDAARVVERLTNSI